MTTTELSLRVSSNNLMLELLGDHDRHLRDIESAFPEVRFVARGNELLISGPDDEAAAARTAVEELLIIVQEGHALEPGQVERVVAMVRDDV